MNGKNMKEQHLFETSGFDEVEKRIFCGSSKPVLHHVCLFVNDVEASVHFYTSGLGMSVKERFDDIVGLGTAGHFAFNVASVFINAGEGRYIELHPAGDGAMQLPGFPLNHLAIAVIDVDTAYKHALEAGGNPYGFALQDTSWDGAPLDVIMQGERSEPMRMAFLQGPGGELVELYQALP